MSVFFAVFAFSSMLFGPALIAQYLCWRDGLVCANNELVALRRVGKQSAGTLYSVPGLAVVEATSESRPSAGSRAA